MKPFWLSKCNNYSLKDEHIFSCKHLRRSGHSTELLPYGFLMIIGGFNDIVINDFNFVDLEKLLILPQSHKFELKRIECSGADYKPVASAASCFVESQNAIYIFGGSGIPWGISSISNFYKLNLPSMHLEDISCPSSPPPLYGATMCHLNGFLWLFGGFVGREDGVWLVGVWLVRWAW